MDDIDFWVSEGVGSSVQPKRVDGLITTFVTVGFEPKVVPLAVEIFGAEGTGHSHFCVG